MADSLKKFFATGGGPHRTGAHGKKLFLIANLPAGILRRHAGRSRMIGRDHHRCARPDLWHGGQVGNVGEPCQRDFRHQASRFQATWRFDAAIHDFRAVFQLVNEDPKYLR